MGSKPAKRDGWTRVRFGDIAEQINDRVDDPNTAGVDRYVGLEHLDPGSLRVTRWGSPDDVSAQKLRFHSGDIIFGKRRAYQRKVAVADFGGICSAHAMVLRERPGAVARGFLIHFMASDVFMERAIQISVGSLSPTINWSALREQEFDLPPIEEQERSLRLLQVIDQVIDCLVECKVQGELIAARLRERFIPPSGRPGIALSELCASERGVSTGPFGSLLHQHDYCKDSDGVPVVMPADMTDGCIDHKNVAKVSRRKSDEMAAYALKPGDILVPRRGELDRRAIVSEADCPALCGTGSIRIRPASTADSMRIFLGISTDATVQYLKSKSQGSIMPSIGAKTVAAIQLAQMSAEERDTYVAQCQAVMATLTGLVNRIEGLRSLRSNVLRHTCQARS